MIGGLKIVQVKTGQEATFEALFQDLRTVMQTEEPGCLVFSLLRSRTKAGTYIVHEQYRDAAALATHESSPHGAQYFPRLRALIESLSVEYFDGVVS